VKSRILNESNGQREFVLVFDSGDEVMSQLKRFAVEQHLTAAHFTGIGALSDATVAWFDLERQKYQPIEIAEQVELLSLAGDVVTDADGKPAVHAHAVVGKRDGTAHGGHLQHAHVRPTLELVLTESPAHLRKTFRPQFGLALIDLNQLP
jgi:predicted DNA-binding protein with PD1-like motif